MAVETRPVRASQGERRVDPRNTLNDMSGGEWLYSTKSVIETSYPSEFSQDLRREHGANKPPRLMKTLIEFFTKGGQRVLDPFAGVGGTLIGASIAKPPRYCEGIEINPRWIEVYNKVLVSNPELKKYPMHVGDCRDVMKAFRGGSFHFIAMDPPYNIHLKRTMCNGQYKDFRNRSTDYNMASDEEGDLANLGSYEEYLAAMQQVFAQCCRVLKTGSYMAVMIRNAYQDGEYMFTHADLARRAKECGLVPKGEIVWYQNGARLRPYGYPFAYVPNIVHQFILILRRPRK